MVKIKRLKNNRLKNVEGFLFSIIKSMDERDSKLLKGIIRRYCSYYRDGEHPISLVDSDGYTVVEGDTSLSIMIALEYNVNEVFTYLLEKYCTSQARSEYSKNKIIKKLKALQEKLRCFDVYSAVNYNSSFLRDIDIINKLSILGGQYESLSSNFNTNMKLSYAKPILLNDSLWNEDHQKEWEDILSSSRKLSKEINGILNRLMI